MLAIRLATSPTGSTIRIHCLDVLDRLRIGALGKILAHDGAQERGCRHRADLEQTHLFLREPHLRDRVVNHNAQLGMKLNLKWIGAHKRAHYAVPRANAGRTVKSNFSRRGCYGDPVMQPQLCCNARVTINA